MSVSNEGGKISEHSDEHLRRLLVAKGVVTIHSIEGREDQQGRLLIDAFDEHLDEAVMLLGGKPTCDVDTVEYPPTGAESGQRLSRCLSVSIDPVGGPLVERDVIDDECMKRADRSSVCFEQVYASLKRWQFRNGWWVRL
jgi:hypothetical protein